MKTLSFFLCVLFCFSFCVTSFAIDLESLDPIENLAPDTESEYPAVEVPASDLEQNAEVPQQEQPETSETESESEPEVNPLLGAEEGELIGITFASVAPITPDDTTGLKSVLLSVIGDYDPVIVEYEYMNNNNYSSYLREVLPDYPWFAGFLMLSLMVYCTFRIGGALIG